MTDLSELYKDILDYLLMKVDDDGKIISAWSLKESIPVTIGGKPLVFMCDKQFNDPNQDKYYFHPLCESYIRGESIINQLIRHKLNFRINKTIEMISFLLLKIASDSTLQSKLDARHTSFIKGFVEIDANCPNVWLKKIVETYWKNYKEQKNEGLVNLFIKSGGTYKNKESVQLAIARFPIYENLKSQSHYTSLTAKERTSFIKVLEYVFGFPVSDEHYRYGTVKRTAPYLETTLMLGYILTSQLEKIITLFEDFFIIEDDDKRLLTFNHRWVDKIKDIESLQGEINRLPKLDGNEGTLKVSESAQVKSDKIALNVGLRPGDVSNFVPNGTPATSSKTTQPIISSRLSTPDAPLETTRLTIPTVNSPPKKVLTANDLPWGEWNKQHLNQPQTHPLLRSPPSWGGQYQHGYGMGNSLMNNGPMGYGQQRQTPMFGRQNIIHDI